MNKYVSKIDVMEEEILIKDSEARDLIEKIPISITPEKFDGTDFNKLQQALDYATANNVNIRLTKMYDISGEGSLLVTKNSENYDEYRTALYITGDGGGIIKNDGGFVFSSLTDNVGDLYFNNVSFIAANNNTILFNCDKLIRISTSKCSYRNITTIAYAPTRWVQSFRMTNDHVIGGNDFLIKCNQSFDVVIENTLIEKRTSGVFTNINDLTTYQNIGLKINNCVIEGNTHESMFVIGSVRNCTISNNYFESNGEPTDITIDLDSLTTNFYHKSMLLTGNYIYLTPEQFNNSTPAIKHGSTSQEAVPDNWYKNGGIVSISNTANGVLHYMPASGYLSSSGDTGSPVVNTVSDRFLNYSRPTTFYTNDNNTQVRWGALNQQRISQYVTFTASERKYVDFEFDTPINFKDMTSVNVTNENVRVDSVIIRSSPQVVRVYLTNLLDTSNNSTVTVIGLKIN